MQTKLGGNAKLSKPQKRQKKKKKNRLKNIWQNLNFLKKFLKMKKDFIFFKFFNVAN